MRIMIVLYVKFDTYAPGPKGLNDFHDSFFSPFI